MTAVAIAGAGGRMGTASAAAIVAAPDLDLVGCFDPGHPGDDVGGLEVSADPAVFDGADVVLEWAPVDADYREASVAVQSAREQAAQAS